MDKFVSMTVRDDSGNECSFGYNGSDDKIAAKVTALLVDGVEVLYVRTLRDRIDTRSGLRLVEYDVFEPVGAVAHQANIFVPRDEQDRIVTRYQ